MGHRFSKSSSISSHGTSTVQKVNTHNQPYLHTSSNSIAIPFAESQINLEIEQYPSASNSTANGIVNHNNLPHQLDNNSLSSVTSSSSCPRFIIKIQLTKMENNGNETSNNTINQNRQSKPQSLNHIQPLSDGNANNIVSLECSATNSVAKNDNNMTLSSKTAGSFPFNSLNSSEISDTLEENGTNCGQYRLVGSSGGFSSKGENQPKTDSGGKYCYRFTPQTNPAFCLKHHCSNFSSPEALKQYMESTSSNHNCHQGATRESTPIAIGNSSTMDQSLSPSSISAGPEQLSIWTPNSKEVIIQSPQIVVLCPSASLVTLSRVNDGFVRGVVGTDVVTTGIESGINSTNSANLNNLQTSNSFSKSCGISNGVVVHSQVDFVHHLVPDLDKITNSSFYWGKMDRYEAERLLEGKPEGTFLLRDSAQEEFLFSVTFRKYGRSLHARIEQSGHKFSFDCHDPGVFEANTVTGLLEHYKDPACVMFFEPMLTVPLHRTQPFSLQQLTRAIIVSNITYDGISKLELPTRLKAYLKEYHYKQKLRTKPCDEFS